MYINIYEPSCEAVCVSFICLFCKRDIYWPLLQKRPTHQSCISGKCLTSFCIYMENEVKHFPLIQLWCVGLFCKRGCIYMENEVKHFPLLQKRYILCIYMENEVKHFPCKYTVYIHVYTAFVSLR